MSSWSRFLNLRALHWRGLAQLCSSGGGYARNGNRDAQKALDQSFRPLDLCCPSITSLASAGPLLRLLDQFVVQPRSGKILKLRSNSCNFLARIFDLSSASG